MIRSFAAIVGLTLAAQLCAIGYEIFVAARFGSGIDADALALTLMLVVAVANETVTWIAVLLLSNYVGARVTAGSVAATRFLKPCFAFVVVATVLLGRPLVEAEARLVGFLAPDLASDGATVGLLRSLAPLAADDAAARAEPAV